MFRSAKRTRVVSTGGSLLLLALLITAGFTIRRAETRRQRLIAELQDSEERTKLLVQTALDAVITVDENGVVTGWNPQAEAIFGWAGAEVMGGELPQLIIPAQNRDLDILELQKLRRSDGTGTPGKRIEITAFYRDGHEFPAEVSAVPIHRGNNLIVSLFVRDITERKQAEYQLQVQLSRLDLLNRITRAVGERQDLRSIFQVVIRTLEDQLPIEFGCMCLYDANRNLLSITRPECQQLHFRPRLSADRAGPDPIDMNGLTRCVQGQLVYEPDIGTSEFPFMKRLAHAGLRSLVIAPLLLEDEVFGALMAARRLSNAFTSGEREFLRQLSEQVALAVNQAQIRGALQQAYDDLRQTQQIMQDQERLRALGQMASGIAHDINNALSPVSLSTQLLLEREPNEPGDAPLC